MPSLPDPRDPDGQRPDDIQGCAPIVWTVIVGVIILTLATAMAKCSADEWTGPDKTKHFVGGAVIAGVCYLGARDSRNPRQSLKIAIGVPLVIGAAKEGFDAMGMGTPSYKDFLATAAGAVVVAVPLYTLDVHFVANGTAGRWSLTAVARW